MTSKKLVVGDYTDPETGLRFVEDDRGNYHLVSSDSGQSSGGTIEFPEPIVITIDSNEKTEMLNKRYKRILEKLRSENNWLWSVLQKAVTDGKKNAKKAIQDLEKSMRERER